MDGTIYSSRVGRSPTQQFQQVWADFNKPKTSAVPQSLNDLIRGQRASDEQRANAVPYNMSGTQNPADSQNGPAQAVPQPVQGGDNPLSRLQQSVIPSLFGGSQQAPASHTMNAPDTSDIPGSPDAPQVAQAPAQLPTQAATVSPQSFQVDKAPSMPSDPTNGKKVYDPESLKTGASAISYGMQNNLPQPQSPVQAQTQAADHDRLQQDLQTIAGSKNPKTAWKDIKKDPFYKDSDFYTGLMNTGLAIMSGANPMEAFQAGKQAMDKATLGTQLGGNKQALIDQGYSPASIEAAITSGDVSKLKMQEMSDQDRMQAQNQDWANKQQYSQDLGNQNYARSRADQLADQNTAQRNLLAQQAASDKRAQQRSDEALRRSKELIDYRGQQKIEAAKADADNYIFGPKEINSEAKNPDYANIKNWSNKNEYFEAADKDLQQAKDSVQDNPSKSRAGYMQAIMQAARGEIGDGRSLQIDDLAHFAEDPSIFVKKGNEWSMKAGLSPTQAQIDYVQNAIDVGKNTATAGVTRLKQRRIDSLKQTYGVKKATAFVNKAYGGEWFDPYNSFDTKLSDSDRQGVLSSANTAGLNDFE